jgi:glycosyltransferase involved in cell wall biosynthesis
MLTVSVIIPTYNREATIARAIESALRECVSGDEIIVVDDASTDQTASILSAYKDRIRYQRIAKGGAGRARNVGIKLARNDLIAFLDSDDEWINGKLSMQRSLHEAMPDLVFCCSDLGFRYENGGEQPCINWRLSGLGKCEEKLTGPGMYKFRIRNTIVEGDEVDVYIGDLYTIQMECIFVSSITSVIKRGMIEDSFLFPEDVRYHEDWEFFTRLSHNRRSAYLDCQTAWAYFHRGPQLTKLSGDEIIRSRIKVLERVWGADDCFLAHHRMAYETRLAQQQVELCDYLLSEKRFREAKHLFGTMRKLPGRYALYKSLPDCMVKLIEIMGRMQRERRKLMRKINVFRQT